MNAPQTADEWQRRAREHVAEYADAVRAIGLPPDDRLQVLPGSSPCPLYLAETMTIEFTLPDATDFGGRLFWCYYASLTGCAGPDEGREFAALLLPLVSAHEVNHHLRHVNGRDTGDHFVEEQVVQQVATDWFEAHPTYGASVPEVRRLCHRALTRLRTLAPLPPELESAYRMNPAEVLAERRALSWRQVRRAEHTAALHAGTVEHALSSVHVDAALASADADRSAARDYFDSHYMQSLAEYWHFGMAWLVSYLQHHRRPDFAASARRELASDS